MGAGWGGTIRPSRSSHGRRSKSLNPRLMSGSADRRDVCLSQRCFSIALFFLPVSSQLPMIGAFCGYRWGLAERTSKCFRN
jgi:hypothetical protein